VVFRKRRKSSKHELWFLEREENHRNMNYICKEDSQIDTGVLGLQ
jgi:hypothetical protein